LPVARSFQDPARPLPAPEPAQKTARPAWLPEKSSAIARLRKLSAVADPATIEPRPASAQKTPVIGVFVPAPSLLPELPARFVEAIAPEPGLAPNPPATAIGIAASETRTGRSFAARATKADERPFPASIMTPVSTPPEPEAAVRDRWRAMISERTAQTRLALRGASDAIATTATINAARVREALSQQAAKLVVRPAEKQPASRIAARLREAIGVRWKHLIPGENALRMSRWIILGAILVALVAYGGGAMIAGLAGTSAAAKHEPEPTQTTQTAVVAPASVMTPPPSPSPTAAARASLYIARAKAGDAAAQYDVGVLYAKGDGLVQDYASAASWFRAAAAQGNITAEYNLGVLYARGLGVAADQTEALNWYRSAADQNQPSAQFNLALAYAEGDGTTQDFAAAARWYQRAAEQGVAPAMVNLAILYEQGSGVDRSPIDAYAWYSAAGERGDAAAEQRAGELFDQFSDKDKARAQGLAATIGATLAAAANPPA